MRTGKPIIFICSSSTILVQTLVVYLIKQPKCKCTQIILYNYTLQCTLHNRAQYVIYLMKEMTYSESIFGLNNGLGQV